MKIMLISDTHYSLRPYFNHLDWKERLEWVWKAAKEEEIDLLVSAGDWGEEIVYAGPAVGKILEISPILTIYGNHDNVEAIRGLTNRDGSSAWLPDGRIVDWNGLRIAGINGNLAGRKTRPHHHTLEDWEAIIRTYKEEPKIDLLVTHEVPLHPSLSKKGGMLGREVVNLALESLKPSLHLSGHIHIKPHIFDMGPTRCINLDEWHYALTSKEAIRKLEIRPFRCS